MKKWIRKRCTPGWWLHRNGSHNVRGKWDFYGKDMERDEDGYQWRKTCSSSFYSYTTSAFYCFKNAILGGEYVYNRWKFFTSGIYWFRRGWKNE